jgi:hypothetical protein
MNKHSDHYLGEFPNTDKGWSDIMKWRAAFKLLGKKIVLYGHFPNKETYEESTHMSAYMYPMKGK